MAGPADEMAAGAGRRTHLRASHADREQVIEMLKVAFVQGRLAKDEFDLRVGQVLASRTYADLNALTAGIPAGLLTAQSPDPAFMLEYQVQPQDVQELLVATPRVKDKLAIAVVAAMVCGLVAAGFTAITVALNYRSAVFSAAGAPGGIYVADLALWLVTAFLAWAAWQRSPGRLAQVLIQKTPEFQGRTRNHVETGGIRAISATGTEAFHPWATIGQVRETTRAFHLLDHHGRARVMLPKRALDSPDLLPALRTFLKQAIAQQPPAATASTAADESQP
jgi:hypothetical protein